MYVTPWKSNSFIRDIENEFTRGLDVMRHWPLNTVNSPFKFSSRVNESTLVIEGVVPGLSKKDLTMEVIDSVLLISSKKESETGNMKFEKHFTIPENSDIDNIGAVCKDGLLTVTIPQIEPEVISKKITVK
jgi:HSP20 family molecular chaperone IbpA